MRSHGLVPIDPNTLEIKIVPVSTTKDPAHITFQDSHGDKCVVTTRDHFEGEGRSVQIRCATHVKEDWVILSEDQARELFNWLGVHLHR